MGNACASSGRNKHALIRGAGWRVCGQGQAEAKGCRCGAGRSRRHRGTHRILPRTCRMVSSRQCHSHLFCSCSVVRCSLPVCVRQLPFGVNTLTRDAMAVQVAEGEPVVDIASASAAEEAAPGAEDRVVSSNAYMLVYRRCEWSSSPGSGPVQLPERCLQYVCRSAVKRRSRQQQHVRWADLSELSACGPRSATKPLDCSRGAVPEQSRPAITTKCNPYEAGLAVE